MNYSLVRNTFSSAGVFGTLFDSFGKPVAVTLEHAYLEPDGTWQPKVSTGSYTCIRGQHQLEGMTQPFSTFEITGVAGHSNILFHMGNYDKDSDGCVLLGQQVVSNGQTMMVTNSVETFDAFMLALDDIDTFELTVS